MNSSLLYADSMIPVLTDNGFSAHILAEKRALKNVILHNYLECTQDLTQLISVAKRIVNLKDKNLESFLYNRLEYMGFSSETVFLKDDMSLKEKILCFGNNFMVYCDTGDISILDILDKI